MIEITIFDSWNHLILAGLIVMLGQTIYTAIGFGSGMVTISLLALCFGNVDLYVPFFLLLCLPAELSVFLKDRDHLDIRRTARVLLFILPGIILGTMLLKSAPGESLVLFLGMLIVVLAGWFLVGEHRLKSRVIHRAWEPVVGMISGTLGGLYGISGPPLIVYFKMKGVDKTVFRVALLTIFLFMTLLRTGTYTAAGLFNIPVLVSTACILPFSLAGMGTGMVLHDRIPERQFKQITSLILLISGLLLIGKSIG